MPSDHPFQLLFETFGKLPDVHSDEVNKEARETMKAWLKVPLEKPGHSILLKAPRAGHGKTHLLTRLQYELGGTHEFIPLHAIGGSRIDAATVLDDTLRRLVRGLPAAGGLTVLDLVARRLFSSSLQPLVNSGEVPCQDREGAINALRTRPIETFDFHHPGAVTAHWARDNFELLGPRLSLELSQGRGLSLREVSFWVDAMFRFSATPIDNPGRVRALAATVFEDPGAEAVAHERLVALLGLLTSLMRVVLVADEIEGFSSDETAALRFASFLGALRQSAERVDVVLSVNEDVWKSAFLPRLSGGLADRLSEVVVELEPLDRAGMLAIIESRSPGDGEKILSEMEPDTASTHARGIIKEAGNAWEDAAQGKSRKKTEKPEKQQHPEKQEEPEPASEEIPPSAAIEPLPEPTPPEAKEPEKPVVDPLSGFAAAASPEKTSETQASAFAAPEPPGKNDTPPAAEVPVKSGFSAEAAIAAFAATSLSESGDSNSDSMFSSEAPSQKEASKSSGQREAPSSWPSPEVSESAFQAPKEDTPSAFAAPSAPEKTEEPVPAFSAAPSEPAPAPKEEARPVSDFTAPPATAREEAAPSMFQAPPVDPTSMFGAPAGPARTEETASAFSAAPPEPENQPAPPIQVPPAPIQEPASMFQAPPAPAEDAVSAFQAAPAEPQPPAFQAPPQENPASAFQAPPPQPQEQAPAFTPAPPAQDTAGAFQSPPVQPAPQESPSEGKSAEASTDRVDDLLRQFRERYGKS